MRTWHAGDPQPTDHPNVNDRRETTWHYQKEHKFWTTDWNEAASWKALLDQLGPLRETGEPT